MHKKTKLMVKIPVSQPVLIGKEKDYVIDCLKSNWISSIGKYILLFEKKFAEFIGVKHAISCSNGTAALHLALLALGIKKNDEVICPTFTFVATANAIKYVGAKPVFIDCEKNTWNLDVRLLEKLITPKTKAIIPVHLYGHPCDMSPIMKIAKKHKIFNIEDSAEAIGSKYKGRMCGSFGDIATFSFYGNKTITTGEGGMVVTNDDRIAERLRILKGQGMNPQKRYWFSVLGYNYRMTNIQAAIGLAQLENVDKFILKRQTIAKMYDYYLEKVEGIKLPQVIGNVSHSFWMYSILIEKEFGRSRDEVIEFLQKSGIETRPFFYPMHVMPVYKNAAKIFNLKTSEEISSKGINLPTFFDLNEADIREVCHHLIKLKVYKINPSQENFTIRIVSGGYLKKLKDFFRLIRSEGSEKFFHPHPFDDETAERIARDSIMYRDLYYLVLSHNENIAGYFMLRGFDEGYEIPSFGVIVHPEFRRKGLGRATMEITINVCRTLKIKKLMLKVYDKNIAAKSLYDSFGFKFSSSKKKNEFIGFMNIGS